MTAKLDAFKAELIELCKKHRVMLGSVLYDSPAIFDMDDRNQAIFYDDLVDRTEPKPRQEGARKENP